MDSLVIYDSQFGNTRTVAEIVGNALKAYGPVRVLGVESVSPENLGEVDLLVAGAPTQAHGIRPAMRPFLDRLQAKPLGGMLAATFDTRLRGPVLIWGSAAKTIADRLRRAGIKLVAPPASSFVTMGKKPQLEAGEAERTRAWAAELGARVSSGQAAAV